jgi:hypothetical protein
LSTLGGFFNPAPFPEDGGATNLPVPFFFPFSAPSLSSDSDYSSSLLLCFLCFFFFSFFFSSFFFFFFFSLSESDPSLSSSLSSFWANRFYLYLSVKNSFIFTGSFFSGSGYTLELYDAIRDF